MLARMLDRLDTQWQRLIPKVARRAVDYARNRGADHVYCGHTHEAMAMSIDGINYRNSGAWSTNRPTYIGIRGYEANIYEYAGRTYNNYSREERREAAAAAFTIAFEPGLSADAGYENLSCRRRFDGQYAGHRS
ncbi:MAG TPA: hypothetical protein VLL97_09615 [Acidobacteriota bacterium]|nr:hypothetical protein [Acidobacteriota bacterium]